MAVFFVVVFSISDAGMVVVCTIFAFALAVPAQVCLSLLASLRAASCLSRSLACSLFARARALSLSRAFYLSLALPSARALSL